ncbi:AraC family transcriptional regulator [Chitinophaga caseinilytica]|uniref:AraC family transcriptional regulator n=1 Tax=Chitinophaga caseinilytica TaxID=2267521 RepID=A0ABZ2YZZ8_9BACT
MQGQGKHKDLPNDELGVKIRSNDNPYVSPDMQSKLLQPRKLISYFIVFIESGSITYNIDAQDFPLTAGQLLFAMPNQTLVPPAKTADLKYFKLLFDENTLALLPQQFPFLVNPSNTQTIALESPAKERATLVFGILDQLLLTANHDTEIILAYLNTLLSEFNSAYFKSNGPVNIVNANLSKFVEFKLVVESSLTEQPSIHEIAEKLALSTNSLYRIVKEYAGTSPKDYFINRLITEAQRRLRYSNTSVKELAYELGFNDPDYFSRLFKKSTGKSITEFLPRQDLSGK